MKRAKTKAANSRLLRNITPGASSIPAGMSVEEYVRRVRSEVNRIAAIQDRKLKRQEAEAAREQALPVAGDLGAGLGSNIGSMVRESLSGIGAIDIPDLRDLGIKVPPRGPKGDE
jgi:hypothetical protein